MTQLVLSHSEEDARTIVKAAFEETSGIEKYYDSGREIIGKTGGGLSSHGEEVAVDISEDPDSGKTPIEVSASKEVEINATANPRKYKRRFISNLEDLREYDTDEVLDLLSEEMDATRSKEVTSEDELPDGSSSVGKSMLLILVFTFIMFFFMMTAMTP